MSPKKGRPGAPKEPPLCKLLKVPPDLCDRLESFLGLPNECFGCKKLYPSLGRTPPGFGPRGNWGGSKWGWWAPTGKWQRVGGVPRWWCWECWRSWWWGRYLRDRWDRDWELEFWVRRRRWREDFPWRLDSTPWGDSSSRGSGPSGFWVGRDGREYWDRESAEALRSPRDAGYGPPPHTPASSYVSGRLLRESPNRRPDGSWP